MKRNRFSILFVIMVFALSCLSTIFVGGEVYAKRDAATASAAWSNPYYKKGILHAVRKCYNKNIFESSVDAASIIDNGFSAVLTTAGMNENTKVAIPSGYGVLSDNTQEITCAELFFGGTDGGRTYSLKSDFTPLLSTIGIMPDDFDFFDANRNSTTSMNAKYSSGTVDKVMNVLGYTKMEKGATKEVTFQWNKKSNYGDDGEIHRTIKLNGNKLEYIGENGDPVFFQINEVDNGRQRVTITPTDPFKTEEQKEGNIFEIDELNVYFPNITGIPVSDVDTIWNNFKNDLYNKVTALGSYPSRGGYFDNGSDKYEFVYSSKDVSTSYYYALIDYMNNPQAFLNRVLKKISGDDNFDNTLGLRYSIKEKVAYYLNAINNYFHAGYNPVDAPAIIECGFDDGYGVGSNRISINIDASGSKKSGCGVLSTGLRNDGNSSIYGFDSSSFFDAGMAKGKLDFYAVVAEINKLSENFDEGSDLTPTDPGTTTQETEADCYSADGLNGMAWVLCPTLYNLEGAAVGISGLIDNMLEVDARYYSSGSETETIWGYMRTIANTFLAIILVAVIFSQLTGYGIDNYGIKKLLPKFVIMVILINVSFLLCQIAIDISNILGQGLNNMFQTMASHDVTFGEVISMVTGGFIALITGAGAYSGLIASGIMAFTSGGNAAVIAVLVLSILAILVGVLIFFLMLGARMIIIILFTAISPIAFACYILPNTQKWFKNWWNVFKTALVMYPICGAVYGLSAVIRSIVFPGGASSVDIHPVIAIVAVLTPVLPYYIMPSLVKSTLSGLGAVGQFFNSIGNGLRKGISEGSHTLQNTGAYKSGTETSQRKMNTWRAGYSRNRKTGALEERKLNGFQKAIRGGKIGMSNAKAAMVRDEEKINAENNLNNDTLMARLDEVSSKQADLDAKSYETQLRSGKIEGVNADNADTVASNLTNLLEKYHKSGDKDERRVLMSKIRGAQAILAESKPGREKVQKAYEDAIKGGYDSALYGGNGAAHYYRQSAGASLNKTKSMDEMVTDLTKSMDNKASDAIRNNVENSYTNKALEKYNADTFASADSKELERYLANIDIMGDDEAGKKYKASLYKLINDAEKSETISISGQVQNLFNQMKAKIGPMPVAGASNGAAVENQEFKVQGVGSALASDQYATPQPRPTETSGQQMLRNGQQWANEVAQNGGTVTKSGIWIPESNNKKPSNPKPNNGGGVM